jgi:hypothetical protein
MTTPSSEALGTLEPEARILMLTAGGPATDEALRELVRAPFRWPLLWALAEREKAVPVLWRRLATVGGVSQAPQEHRQLALVHDFRAAHLEEVLGRVLDTLATARVEAILLKGAALAVSVYPRFGDRPMGDLDLLIDRRDAETAQRALRENGWYSEDEPSAVYVDHHHLPPLLAKDGSTALELHTGLFAGRPFSFGAEEVRAGATTVEWKGRRVRVPDPHHLLVHLCTHFAFSHEFTGGVWRAIRDVQALVAGGSLSWERVVREARAAGATRECYWTLRLARALAGVDVDAGALRALEPGMPAAVLTLLERHFLTLIVPSAQACPSTAVTRAAWTLALKPKRGGPRPWDPDEQFLEEVWRQPRATKPAAGRFVAQVANVRRWREYLALVLRSAS